MDRTTTLTPIRVGAADLDDPRRELGETALALASRNAFPIVASRTARKDGAGLAAGGAIALLLGGLTFWSMSGARELPAPPPALRPAQAPAPKRLPPPLAPMAVTAPVTQPIAPPLVASAPAPTIDHAHSPVIVYDVSSSPAPTALGPAASATPEGPGQKNTVQQPLGDNEAFAARVGGSDVEIASATRMVDPANTISQGTLIAAVLETAINSDLPGYVRAIVSQDVKSFDGQHVLIPRSSRLIGQYKSGLAAGQTRAYVMWTRLIRPDGASVALASPSTDYAGAAGLTGKVDGHFMKRFGSAMLLSVVGGLGALGSSETSLVLSSGGTSAASVAAQRDAQIPPTIRVPQGQPIRIFTARDLNFATVGGAVQEAAR